VKERERERERERKIEREREVERERESLPDEQVGNAGLERDRKRERDRKEAVRKSPREKENEKRWRER
jgi:hypothetical protein